MAQYRRLFGAHRKAVQNDADEMRVCEVRRGCREVGPYVAHLPTDLAVVCCRHPSLVRSDGSGIEDLELVMLPGLENGTRDQPGPLNRLFLEDKLRTECVQPASPHSPRSFRCYVVLFAACHPWNAPAGRRTRGTWWCCAGTSSTASGIVVDVVLFTLFI